VIFVGGLSGTGKTFLASASRLPVLSLDRFFFSVSQPDLPKWFGRPDWESMESFEIDAAVAAVSQLAHGHPTSVPMYDHIDDQRVGTEVVHPAPVVVAEGVYAPHVYAHAIQQGIPSRLLVMRTGVVNAFVARLVRDVRDRKMNCAWAVLRSSRLAIRHRSYLSEAREAGAELVTRESALSRLLKLSEDTP
jgi:uridine kinase